MTLPDRHEGVGFRFSAHPISYTVEVTSWGDYGVGYYVNFEVDPVVRPAACPFETLGDFRNKD